MGCRSTDLKSLLALTCEHATNYLESLVSPRAHAKTDLTVLRRGLAFELSEDGARPEDVINQLVAATQGGIHPSAGGRFFAWVMGGGLSSALAADWLVSTWDNNAALYSTAPAAAVCEEVAGSWLKDLLRLPASASFAFTTGCQMAHATCLAAARHQVLAVKGWNVEEEGLNGAPRIRVLASALHHASVERALSMLGIGRSAVFSLLVDDDGRVIVEAFSTMLNQSSSPTIVVLDAGDLNIAAFDPFEAIISLAHAAGAWVHVDGAFGLWAQVSPKYSSVLRGVEQADSWATDAHKWLNTPNDIGLAFVANAEAHRAAMDVTGAAYIGSTSQVREPLYWTPEWTRRARGFPVYAALRELGRSGVKDLIERCCALAYDLVSGIGRLEGAEVVALPTLNQGLVRFIDQRATASHEDHDTRTRSMIEHINGDGVAFFSGTTWRGRFVMRVSVVNWRTSQKDVQATLDSIGKVISI